MSKPNALVLQSGGSTPVLNRSLAGVVRQAGLARHIDQVYGAIHALDGVLAGNLVDLSGRSKAWWNRTARTPGAVLGSSRRRLTEEDVPKVLQVLTEHRIRFCFIIGGNDSAETGHTIDAEAENAGMALSVVNVPKTIDNDLVLTDHTPGYGSAARFVALTTMGAGRDAESMGKEAPITIIEVMGRDAGWLAAASALASRSQRDAPHVVCIPEVPVDEDRFVDLIEEACGRYGFAVAVIAENTRGTKGPLGGTEPWYVDQFGHPYYEGAGRHLAEHTGRRLNVRVRYEKPGTIQRAMVACISTTDTKEAEAAGRAAVECALDGASDQMVTLVRTHGEGYRCSTGLAPLGEVAGQVKQIPNEFFDNASYMPTQAFVEYARPLIGEALPRFERLM